MKTHILIPIKNIEDLLNKIQSASNLPIEDDVMISRNFTEQYLLDPNHCKQISLDEEVEVSFITATKGFDDEGVASPYEHDLVHRAAIHGYKQSIKDLLV